jgi:hypothetical protein
MSDINMGKVNSYDERTTAWGLAFNVNENLSISYGEREVEYNNDTVAVTGTTEKGDGVAVAYTMGSIKIAGNRNTVSDNGGVAGTNDSMTEIAVSFAF